MPSSRLNSRILRRRKSRGIALQDEEMHSGSRCSRLLYIKMCRRIPRPAIR